MSAWIAGAIGYLMAGLLVAVALRWCGPSEAEKPGDVEEENFVALTIIAWPVILLIVPFAIAWMLYSDYVRPGIYRAVTRLARRAIQRDAARAPP